MNKQSQKEAIGELKKMLKQSVRTELHVDVKYQLGATSYGAFIPQKGGLKTTTVIFTIQSII